MQNSRNNRVAHTCSAAICRSASASRAASTTGARPLAVGRCRREERAGGRGGTTRGGSSTGCDKAGSSGGGSSAGNRFVLLLRRWLLHDGRRARRLHARELSAEGCGMIMSCGMSSIRARCAIICASTAVMGAAEGGAG